MVNCFEMSDGSIIRECANSDTIWMASRYKLSFGKYRNVESGSLSMGIKDWVKTTPGYSKLFGCFFSEF